MDLKEIVNALMRAAKLEAAVGTVNLKEGKSELWAECLFEASDYKRMAREIEQMRCENCRWWAFDGHVGAPLWECDAVNDDDGDDCASVSTCGPSFYCKHYTKR